MLIINYSNIKNNRKLKKKSENSDYMSLIYKKQNKLFFEQLNFKEFASIQESSGCKIIIGDLKEIT